MQVEPFSFVSELLPFSTGDLAGMSGKKTSSSKPALAKTNLVAEAPKPWYERYAGLVALCAAAAQILAVVLMAIFWAIPHIEQDIRYGLNADINEALRARGFDHISEDVSRIRGSLDALQPLIQDLVKDRMHRTASLSQKEFGSELPRIKQTTGLAVSEKVPIPEREIETIGHNAIRISQENTELSSLAWQVVLDLASCRSFLNIIFKPKGPISPLPKNIWWYAIKNVRGRPPSEMRFSGEPGVPKAEAAQYDEIGTDRNSNFSVGPVFLILVGGATEIDGMSIRNTIFEGVEVHYSGGPIILQKAIFVNCTFVMGNSNNTKEFGQQLISSATINFKNT